MLRDIIFPKGLISRGLLGAFLFGGIFSAALGVAHAQTAAPQFLITWKASGSYIPASYIGKAIPTYGSSVTAELELLSRGQIVNLQNQTIYWYQNDTLIGGGVGVQQITFRPFGAPPNSNTLKVELPNYPGGLLVHEVQVPMVQPQAVIYAPYPADQVSINPVLVKALAYFFNTPLPSDLSFSWSVNGQTGTNTENPDQASIDLPAGTSSGTDLSIALTIQNPADASTAIDSTDLIYQQQL